MEDHRIDIAVNCAIPRVPESLRAVKSKAFLPRRVSLGPFHHGSHSELDDYDDLKHRLSEAIFGFEKEQFEALVNSMRDDRQFISRIRHCYALSDSTPTSKELGELMVIDGFFLLHCLRDFSDEYKSRWKSAMASEESKCCLQSEMVFQEYEMISEEFKRVSKEDMQATYESIDLVRQVREATIQKSHILEIEQDRRAEIEHRRAEIEHRRAEIEHRRDKIEQRRAEIEQRRAEVECRKANPWFEMSRKALPFAAQEDIMKLENQIPLFALQKVLQWEAATLPDLCKKVMENLERKQLEDDDGGYLIRKRQLYEWLAGAGQDLNSTLRLACHNLYPFPDMRDRRDEHVSPGGALGAYSHLLEFLYEHLIRSSHPTHCTKFHRRRKNKRGTSLPSAVELKRKGVTFAADVKFLNDICFDVITRTFHLPKTNISKRTVVLMENLVAFEALSRKDGKKPLKRYVDLMDCLINTSADAQVLIDSGIVNDILHPDEVASAWKRTGKGLEKGEYEPIDTAVTTFMMYNTVRVKYFTRAWLVLSSITGFILLLLSVCQTIIAWQQLRLQQESMKNV